MNNKGFTYLELLVVLAITLIIFGFIGIYFVSTEFFAKARDNQRISDAFALANILNAYMNASLEPDFDGPFLINKGINQSEPTIFLSLPLEDINLFRSCYYKSYGQIYFIYQTHLNNLKKIDGKGWLPVDFSGLRNQYLNALPVDPINSFSKGLYYLYAFQTQPLQYEISISFESESFLKNGASDKVSTDGGDDDNRFEVGTNLRLIPPFLWRI